MKLKGKIALITGGNSGIGLATAKLFKAEGATVITTASSQKSYEIAKKEYGSEFEIIKTDVSNNEELKNLFKTVQQKHGGIDVLFVNAGVALFRPTEAIDLEFYDQLVNVNLQGLFFTVQYALPILNAKSSVILTGSSSSIKGMPGASIYSATKAAVRSLARTWTAEIPTEKVRFNVLHPGPTETPIFAKMGLTPEQEQGMMQTMIPIIPSHRIGKPEEIARVALFLASDDSSFMMGSEVYADGGLSQV